MSDVGLESLIHLCLPGIKWQAKSMLLRQPWLLVFGNVGLSDTASFRPISLWWKVRGRGVLRPYRPGTPGPCGRAARRASSGCARCRSTTTPAAAATLGPAHDGQTREPRAPAGPHFATFTHTATGNIPSSRASLLFPFHAIFPSFHGRRTANHEVHAFCTLPLQVSFVAGSPSWPGVLRGRESLVAWEVDPTPTVILFVRQHAWRFLSAQRLASGCNGRSRCSMLTVLSTAWGAPFGMHQEPGGQLRLTAYPPTQCTKKVSMKKIHAPRAGSSSDDGLLP